ncbi:MAG: M14 family metallopeptidase [Candidatus Marinimicrobia bacterium]|nr:M14 family metallopeptidase [Candidatus Neomarinimicrobiota bacterium]
MKRRNCGISAVGWMMLTISGFLFAENWQTDYEKSGFLETPRYAETIKYCQRLDTASTSILFTSFGVTPLGRDLPLLIFDSDGNFTPEKQKQSGKALVMFIAGIHAGEIDGKDAGLMLLRDMVVDTKYVELMKNVTLLFIPIFNVDGHERFSPYNRFNQIGPKEMGWRVTAQNYNLNRDFSKADSPEMRAWLGLFQQWLPDLIVDIHVTDGADYQYAVTYGMEQHVGAIAEPVRKWNVETFLPMLKKGLEADGFPLGVYVIQRDEKEFMKGLSYGVASPRFSNGYGAIQNRPCILIETHMLKDYKTRVSATYQVFKNVLSIISEKDSVLKKAVSDGDAETAAIPAGTSIPLNFSVTSDSVFIEFKGFGYRKEFSEISGSDRVIWTERPVNYYMPFFTNVIPTARAEMPYAYLIPAELKPIVEILKLHGAKIDRLKTEQKLKVASYKFSNVSWQSMPSEGRHPVSFSTAKTSFDKNFPAGTFVVLMNQRTNRIVTHLLEPEAVDSFVKWGFFDGLFEQKEYGEPYVLEDTARKMLAENPELKRDFERKIENNPKFAADPLQRLFFFFDRSPFHDEQLNVYPISKVMKPVELNIEASEK